jgi:hypothetical protein
VLNGITVYCEGQTHNLELDKRQAEKFLAYVGIASEAESVGPRPSPLPANEVERRVRRSRTVEEQADNFRTHLLMLANLDVRQLAIVIALLDLIEYGDSWMLETINDLLGEVLCEGPAKANERNPRDVLAEIAFNIWDWWDTIGTARSHVAQHPRLLTPATPEPPAESEWTQPATKQPSKAQRARKPRKKAAHA